jgi:predicted ATPase
MITIELANVGPLKSASIDVGGLTVLGGANNTGKTFISKTVFSLIKTIKDSELYRDQWSEEKYDELNFKLFKLLDLPRYSSRKYQVSEIVEKEEIESIEAIEERIRSLRRGFSEQNLREIELLLDKPILSSNEKLGKGLSELKADIEKLKSELENSNTEADFKRCFENLILTTFKKQFNNLFSEEAGKISVYNDNKEELISLSIDNNKVKELKLYSDLSFLGFNEVTCFFSPIVLRFFKFISLTASRRYLGLTSTRTNFRNEYEISKSVGSIEADLLSKLSKSIEYNPENEFQSFLDKLKELVGGVVEYDDRERDFVFRFEKNNKKVAVPVSNTAEGVKAFGILQLLFGVDDLFTQNSLLLFDEPEVHLHPEWQVELAKLLVKLAESGIPIFVSSHSPYMLEALSTYANRSEILKDDFRLYYLEADGQNGSVLKNLTNEDSLPLFEKMSDAMSSLIHDIDD